MKIVSLDVWDTILRRTCHPDEIKIATADYILSLYLDKISFKYHNAKDILLLRQCIELEVGSESQKKGFDDEYKINDVISILLNTLLGDSVSSDLVYDVVDFEKKMEFNNTYIDPTIKKFIDEKGYDKCFFISDFYFGSQFIKELLAHHGVDFVFDGIASCDVGLNKRSGRLFDWFLEEYAEEILNCDEYYHVGDNQWSDLKVPKSKGVKAYLYLPEKENSKRKILEERFKKNKTVNLSFLKKSVSSPDAIGRAYSPLFYSYLYSVLCMAKARKLKKIFFMTREGEFFKSIYDLLNMSLPADDKGPESEIICVSRVATFFPSLREISLSELMRVWNLYSSQSMMAFFKTLGVDVKLFEVFIHKYNLCMNELIVYPWLDARVKSLFNDDEFIRSLELIQKSRKEAISSYFSSVGLTNVGCFGLVDIGWRGTIQDNISYLLPDARFVGFYLGLEKFLNQQPSNSVKIAFGPNLNLANIDAELFRTVAPLEMISNSPNGSVINYIDAVPVRKVDEQENLAFNKFSHLFQLGVLDGVKSISNVLNGTFVSLGTIKTIGMDSWRELISQPPSMLADTYFSLMHNEDFGLGEMVDKSKKISVSEMFLSLFFSKKRQHLRRLLASLYWPEGYFCRTDLTRLDKLLTVYLLKFAIVYRKTRIKVGCLIKKSM